MSHEKMLRYNLTKITLFEKIGKYFGDYFIPPEIKTIKPIDLACKLPFSINLFPKILSTKISSQLYVVLHYLLFRKFTVMLVRQCNNYFLYPSK